MLNHETHEMTRKLDFAKGARLWSQTQPQQIGLLARAATGAPHTAGLLICVAFTLFISFAVHAETVSIIVASNAAPRVVFGAEKLAEALKAVKLDAAVIRGEPKAG